MSEPGGCQPAIGLTNKGRSVLLCALHARAMQPSGLRRCMHQCVRRSQARLRPEPTCCKVSLAVAPDPESFPPNS
eukprot:604151-Rhodomonas_salina.7